MLARANTFQKREANLEHTIVCQFIINIINILIDLIRIVINSKAINDLLALCLQKKIGGDHLAEIHLAEKHLAENIILASNIIKLNNIDYNI